MDSSTLPLLSVRVISLPAAWVPTVTMIAPWVDSPPKFTAMPELPTATSLPPVMTGEPSQSSAPLPLFVGPFT